MHPEKPEVPKSSRLPVSLSQEDSSLITELRYILEKRLGKTLTIAEVIRISLRAKAEQEGVQCQ